ncbi:hypothetical protein [Paenibacillus gansuensis]|uniref:Next to BRCA1 central domain-containing protein n=1 Tax=Paenibacillus gansuensis TaxID=306542 RepID=A0ABW5PF79_9BACL
MKSTKWLLFWVMILMVLLLPDVIYAEANVPLKVTYIENTTPAKMRVGNQTLIKLKIMNTGSEVWNKDEYFISYHWLATDGSPVMYEGPRIKLKHDVIPGTDIQTDIRIVPPAKEGAYILQWDMVHEGVTWFSKISKDNTDQYQVTVVKNNVRTFWFILFGILLLSYFFILKKISK